MKRYISFSGGVESTTMAILYGKGATILIADTGAEHKEMYQRWKYVEQKLKELHNGDFEVVYLKGKVNVKGKEVSNLTDCIIGKGFFPNAIARFCTYEFKIKPIELYLSTVGECELLIGFNADETFDREGNYMELSNVHYKYQLADDGLTRGDCEEILLIHNLHPSLPAFMARGGCKYCFFKSEKEYKAMYHLDRETFDEVQQLEEKLQDKRKKFYAIQQNGKPFSVMRQEAASEINFDWNEVYKEVEKRKPCGVFCHR